MSNANDELDHVLEDLASNKTQENEMDFVQDQQQTRDPNSRDRSPSASRHRSRSPVKNENGGDGLKPSKRVFITNLSYETTWQILKDFMGQIGEVVFSDVYKNFDGRPKGLGIVEFTCIEDATRAIEKLNGVELDGRSLMLRYDQFDKTSSGGGRGSSREPGEYRRPPPPRRSDDYYEIGRRDEYDSRRRDRSYDRRRRSRSRSRSRSHHRSRRSSRDRYRSRSRSRSRGERRKTRSGFNVFVGNLPWRTDWRDLKDLFRKAGNIVSADVLTDRETGRSKGCGIVSFEDGRSAEDAIRMFDGQDFNGRRMEVRSDKFQ